MSCPPVAVAAVAAFVRRTAVAGALAGAATATFWLAMGAAAAGIAVRWQGDPITPQWWWTGALAPIVLGGWLGARARRLDAATAAAHLDRRLELGGLLLAAHDGVHDATWQAALEQRLRSLPAALPAYRWSAFAVRPLLAIGLVVLVAIWPDGRVVATARGPGAFAGVLQALQERVVKAVLDGQIPKPALDAIAGKLTELATAAVLDDPAAWRELDALAQRFGREQLLASLTPAGAAAGREAEAPGSSGDAGAALAMRSALDGLRALTEDAGVPALARSLLERAMKEAGGVARDPREFRAAAERLRGLAQRLLGDGDIAAKLTQLGLGAANDDRVREFADRLQRVAGLALAPRAPAAGAGDLSTVPAGADGGGSAGPAGGAVAQGGSGPGGRDGGGSGRGPGAALRLGEPVPGGAGGEFVLPPGAAVPDRWSPTNELPSAPGVAPVPGVASGASPAAGSGGASWQLQVAPRHRAVVQRFFAADDAAAAKDKR